VDVLLQTRPGPAAAAAAAADGMGWRGDPASCPPFRPGVDDEATKEMRIFTVPLEAVQSVSAARLFLPQDLIIPEPRRSVGKSLKEVLKRFPDGVPQLDPKKDMGIKGDDFDKLLARRKTLEDRLASHALTKVEEEERLRRISAHEKKSTLLEGAVLIRREARSAQSMVMREELKRMKRVLREAGHVDEAGVIQTKGRSACEINTGDELVVTELLFDGSFNGLTTEQCVALLSCLIFDERIKDDDPAAGLKGGLLKAFRKLQDVARGVAKTVIACKVELDEEEFVNKFNPGMMEAVHAWCGGAKFVEVQKLTDTYEGSTIRMMRRLEELVRQLASAARAIGNHELQAKFEKGSELIKRDIVFCASLYL